MSPEEGVSPPSYTESEAPIVVSSGKMFYKSAELWTAFISLVAFGLQSKYGYILPLDVQASLVVVLLAIFRSSRTSEPIAWSKTQLTKLQERSRVLV